MPDTYLRRFILPAALLLASAAVLAVLVMSMLPAGFSGRPEDDNTVIVNDGANLVSIVPQEGAAVSMLQAGDFAADGDMILYTESDYRTRQGIDVSEFQGQIDWHAVKDSGVEFAYLRIGYRGSTEGLLHEDAMYRRNLAGAREAGIEPGIYFFSQAISSEEAREEAEWVLSLLDSWTPDLPVMFDWEPFGADHSRSQTADTERLTDCAMAFCDCLADAGYGAGVYLNRQQGYYVYDIARLQAYTLWVSDPNESPDFYYAFSLWQYTFSGTVPGIGTAVDRDLLFIPASAE